MLSPKVKSSLSVALAIAAVMLTVAVAPASAAQVELVNKTVSVDDNTQSVYVEVNNTDTAQAGYSVDFTELDSSGATVGTVDSRTALTTAAGSTGLVEKTGLNTTTESVRVVVSLDDTTAAASNVYTSTGTIQKVASGSGGLLGGSSGTPVALLAGLGLVGYLFLRE